MNFIFFSQVRPWCSWMPHETVLGLVLAFALGLACWALGIPSPAPPMILGALIGYLAVDRCMSSPAQHAADCAGPSGLPASQAPPRRVGS